MSRVVTYSVKIESDIRDEVTKYCEHRGIKIRKFIENALQHEIRLETAREEAFSFDKAFDNYEKRKKDKGVDFLTLMEEPKTGYVRAVKKGKRKK
jgi:hypothetical protein